MNCCIAPKGSSSFKTGRPPGTGGVEQLVGGICQPVQVMLLGRLRVQHRTAETVHGRAGAVKVDAQRLGRDLADGGHSKDLPGWWNSSPPARSSTWRGIAAFLNGAAAHKDQLPGLRLAGRE